MKSLVVLGSVFLVFAASSHAQESFVGKYNGTFLLQTQSRGLLPIGISMEITSAAGGKLQGKAVRSSNSKAGMGCVGEYKLEGTYQGNKIEMESEPGGRDGRSMVHAADSPVQRNGRPLGSRSTS